MVEKENTILKLLSILTLILGKSLFDYHFIEISYSNFILFYFILWYSFFSINSLGTRVDVLIFFLKFFFKFRKIAI
jgi:hypothetical protein